MLDTHEFFDWATEAVNRYLSPVPGVKCASIENGFKLISPLPFGQEVGTFVAITERAAAYPFNRNFLEKDRIVPLRPALILTNPEEQGFIITDARLKRKAMAEILLRDIYAGTEQPLVLPLDQFEFLQFSCEAKVRLVTHKIIVAVGAKGSMVYRLGDIHSYS